MMYHAVWYTHVEIHSSAVGMQCHFLPSVHQLNKCCLFVSLIHDRSCLEIKCMNWQCCFIIIFWDQIEQMKYFWRFKCKELIKRVKNVTKFLFFLKWDILLSRKCIKRAMCMLIVWAKCVTKPFRGLGWKQFFTHSPQTTHSGCSGAWVHHSIW
jgi:hypothetical protein